MIATSRPFPRRPIISLAALCVAAAACSDGGSAIDAGRDAGGEAADPTVTADDASDRTPESETDDDAPDDDAPDDDAPGGDDSGDEVPSGDDSGDDAPSTDADATVTDAEPDVAVSPLADLPPCPVDALDSAAGPVDITLWFGLPADLQEELQSLTDEYNAAQDRVQVTIENQRRLRIDHQTATSSSVSTSVPTCCWPPSSSCRCSLSRRPSCPSTHASKRAGSTRRRSSRGR